MTLLQLKTAERDCRHGQPRAWQTSIKGRACGRPETGGIVMRVDRLDKLAAVARPSCRKCKHPLTVDRVSPGVRGFQELTFKCSTCGHIEKLATPVDPVRTDAAGWLASELIPPK